MQLIDTEDPSAAHPDIIGEAKISIITVVKDGQKCLEDTIKSVISQSYKNYEYIIIDGKSTDDTVEIIKRYEKYITHWMSEKDNGIYDAMNKGIKLAKGDSINLLNCGDMLSEDALNKVASKMNLKDSVVYSDYYRVYNDLNIKRYDISTLSYWFGMTICHQSMFVGKDVYKNFGVYKTSYRLASDYEMLLRLRKANVQFEK
ncbi:glycosyltransferase family 2 protein, partial [Campylobacterota bacterium]